MKYRSLILRLAAMLLISLGAVGCGNQPADGEHEQVEHFVPLHWPSDLLDAAEKITVRTSRLSGQSSPAESQMTPAAADDENQLRDIVGWVPEIAAGTDLTEQQWNPVYQASETLSKRLVKMQRPLDDATLGAIDEYCKMLAATASLLPAEEVEEKSSSEPEATQLEESTEESQ